MSLIYINPYTFAAAAGIVTSGLVLNLDAGDAASYPGSGSTWTDLTVNGNDGTLNGNPTYTYSDGGAIVFDGSNDYVALGGPASLNNQYTTHEVWVKFDNATGGAFYNIISRLNTSPGTFTMLKTNTNVYIFNTRNSSNSIAQVTLSTAPVSSWTQLVHSYDGTTVRTYVNGVADNTSTSISGPLNTSGAFDMKIATNNSPANYLDGNISVVRAYDRALTAAEIAQNYDALKGRYGLT